MPRWPKKTKKVPTGGSTPANFVFALKAQDLFTPDVIRYWANRVAQIRGPHHPKVVRAQELADQIEKERENKLVKVPD